MIPVPFPTSRKCIRKKCSPGSDIFVTPGHFFRTFWGGKGRKQESGTLWSLIFVIFRRPINVPWFLVSGFQCPFQKPRISSPTFPHRWQLLSKSSILSIRSQIPKTKEFGIERIEREDLGSCHRRLSRKGRINPQTIKEEFDKSYLFHLSSSFMVWDSPFSCPPLPYHSNLFRFAFWNLRKKDL